MGIDNNFGLVPFTLPAVAGDILTWGESCFVKDEQTGKWCYTGHRQLYAELLSIEGDQFTLKVLACMAFVSARAIADGKTITRPAARILSGHPRREWWSCEDERRAKITPAASTPAPQAPKP